MNDGEGHGPNPHRVPHRASPYAPLRLWAYGPRHFLSRLTLQLPPSPGAAAYCPRAARDSPGIHLDMRAFLSLVLNGACGALHQVR